MDDRRFDSLVKAVASGTSRRAMLKSMLGLGGAVLAGSTLQPDNVDAARRPTPTPRPPTCPGRQFWDGSDCVCPDDAPDRCGPDCCADTNYPSPDSRHSECCDNACCFGTCYGEELCCPTNVVGNSPILFPPTHKVCETNDGIFCCPFLDDCCLVDGCCETVCVGGPVDADYCCTSENYCPSNGAGNDLCCTDGLTCCDADTGFNACVDLSGDGCCTVDDCGSPDEFACNNHQCVRTGCGTGEISCRGTCVSDQDHELCASDPAECCQSDIASCCGDAGCCPLGQCTTANTCCGTGSTACGVTCCDDATETCNAENICECKSGLLACEGACIDAQCCGSDNSNCAELGYDLECIRCEADSCSSTELDHAPCGTNNSWCSNGQCVACIPYLSYGCRYDYQCCNGTCLNNRCDTQ